MKKILIPIILLAFIVPQIVFASWWNPISWFNNWTFHSNTDTQTQALEKRIVELESKLNSNIATTSVASTTSINTEAEYQKLAEEKKAQADKIRVALFASTTAADAAKIKAEDEKIRAALKSNTNQNTVVTQPQQQTVVQTPQPVVVPAGKNYHDDLLFKVKTLISIEKSYESWLQDTSDQFRSASLTLAGYTYGGLYGQSRDAAIKLSNANISVISSQLTSSKQRVSSYEGVLDVLNSDSTGFVNETMFNGFRTPESLELDFTNNKKKINESLSSVMTSLQFH